MENFEFVQHFIEKMQNSKDMAELDLVAKDIKEWRELLLCHYTSNRDRITIPIPNLEDGLNAAGKKALKKGLI